MLQYNTALTVLLQCYNSAITVLLECITCLSHLVGKLIAEFGMDNVRRVSHGRVLERVRLLTVFFLLARKGVVGGVN